MTTVRETHIATVVDNNDPEKRGRLLVASASLLGVDDGGEAVEFPNWVEPVFPVLVTDNDGEVVGGIFYIPGIGSTIELEIASGSAFDQIVGQSMSTSPDPRWRAQLLQVGDIVPDEFVTNYPNRAGWLTRSGHLLMFDDSGGDGNKLVLRHGLGSFIAIDGNGSIQLATNKLDPENPKDVKKHLVYVNAKDGEISIVDSNKNVIGTDPDGVKITAGNGTTMVTIAKNGTVSIVTGGEVAIQAGVITLNAPAVTIGAGAVLPALRGGTLAVELLAEFGSILSELGAIATALGGCQPGSGVPYTPSYVPNPALGAAALSPATKML